MSQISNLIQVTVMVDEQAIEDGLYDFIYDAARNS
jgi:hypothetical protein